ncbi:MAG: AAA family ATPase [Massilia sp.]|uniref:AAA family ATPase n=1 Tax=Massilia sp. TaxID=1882437 RepID=UPI002FC992C2
MNTTSFVDLRKIAAYLRSILESKKYVLLFAYNGTGKTRLSMEFKELGKQTGDRDTLYFNAFTEDLFIWDNDLEDDLSRELRLNTASRFFYGLENLEIETRIRSFLRRYTDFDFRFATKKIDEKTITYISFEREDLVDGHLKIVENIKISRGEENIFIWSFFLAIVQLAFDAESAEESYGWVKYIYIDDPVSSLDENFVILVACDLARLIQNNEASHKLIVSTHHSLFFNVFSNELKNLLGRQWQKELSQFFVSKNGEEVGYLLSAEHGDTPSLYHLSILSDLRSAVLNDRIRIYHFNILRSVLEKTAVFFGQNGFGDCINENKNKEVYARVLNLFSHGKGSIYTFREPDETHKELFKSILNTYLDMYEFNLPEISFDNA